MKIKSLKHTFIVYISFAIILTLAGTTLIYNYLDYKKNLKIFKNNIYTMINNTYPVYQNYLWMLDKDNIIRITDSLLATNFSICSIKIKDEFGKLIYNKFNKNKFCNKKDIINIEKKIFYNKKYIGKVEFFISQSFLKENFEKIFLANFFLSLLLAIVVLILIILIFYKFFTKPLTNIISNLRKVQKGNYSTLFEKVGFQEFDEIIEDLNLMVNEINKRDIKNKELSERLNIIVNNIPEGFIILDEKGQYIDINESFVKMLKMNKEEVLLKKITDFSSKNYTLEKGYEKINNIKNKGYDEFEWEIIDKEGNIIPVFVKGKKIKLGKENFLIFTITDISYIKQLEKELLIKEKLNSLGVLAGGIAHDFNNILTSLSGGVELSEMFIEIGKLEKAKENLKKVFKSINRAKFLTHQLLTFSKGGAPVKRPFFDLKELIQDTVSFILTGSSIEVKYDFDKELKPVKIDSDQISLVIQNIVLNAKQSMENKGILEVKAVNDMEYVKISFKDYGKGIPDEIIDKIWEPYFTTKNSGSGLGLSIVYSIIKNHGGYVKVYSEFGEFTEFQIFIPAIDSNKNNNILNNKKEFQSQLPHNLEILVMDDNIEIKEIIKNMLNLLGNKVDTVSNGEEAIECFKNKEYDLVFLDLTIVGGMGGKECIKELRKINKNFKAIVFSGYFNDPVMTNFKEYGFDSVLKKPFNLEELKQAINECFLN